METITDVSALEDSERFESIVKAVDLVCVTDWDERGIVSISGSSIQTSNIEEIYLLQSDSFERDMSKTSKAILCWRDVWTYWLHFL